MFIICIGERASHELKYKPAVNYFKRNLHWLHHPLCLNLSFVEGRCKFETESIGYNEEIRKEG